MTRETNVDYNAFLEIIGYYEEPFGIFYTDNKPEEGVSPNPMPGLLPTRDRELRNEIDWSFIFENMSCVIQNVWRARKKKTAAYFDHDRFGCSGAGFFLGYFKPQTELVIRYVSTGIPGRLEGEHYMKSPEECRSFYENLDPRRAPKRYCVFKPLNLFSLDETPELVAFFCRPECLSGLHQLARFVTGDNEAVSSVFGSACSSLVTWPLHYLERKEYRAVLGGWDPSARKYYKTDELSFTVPWQMFLDMLALWQESFLSTKTWASVRKSIEKSRKAWRETE